MEREILFRGKRVDNGEWVKGSYLSLNIGKKYICDGPVWIGTLNPCKHDIIPETVGQYTGLTDREDTMIFEGDILEAVNGNRGYVLFENGAFMKLSNGEDVPFAIAGDVNTVIGNIHDNPELMKGETNV